MPKLRAEKIATVNKTFHRSHTSPTIQAKSTSRQNTLDWEDREKVRDMLVGSGKQSNSGKRTDGATNPWLLPRTRTTPLN